MLQAPPRPALTFSRPEALSKRRRCNPNPNPNPTPTPTPDPNPTRLPFEAESTQLLYKKIRQGVPSLPSHILPAASSLLHGMLEVAPEKRLALAHVPTPCREHRAPIHVAGHSLTSLAGWPRLADPQGHQGTSRRVRAFTPRDAWAEV